jgi:phytoene dehydrogenase-like protein
VRSLDDLPAARATILDVTPRQLLAIAGDRLSGRYRRALTGYRYGAGVFKVDYALSAPVPWSSPECAQAATVHLGGSFATMARAEADVAGGRVAAEPFVIVAQPTLFDPSRAPAGRHTLWAYAPVPAGSTVDLARSIEDRIERFAPGFRDVVLARHAMTPAALEAHNENCVGGDIAGGSPGGRQLFFRPALTTRPYATPAPGVYICSSSTPPGPGVHGMCGYWAARAVLRDPRSRR